MPELQSYYCDLLTGSYQSNPVSVNLSANILMPRDEHLRLCQSLRG